ncbi:MAG: SMP-30/gluconolactonase/LRE family protein [Gluconacetobacter diazotrophicus]|nr:SMP-30/gluconolactonase/LRE family protein [Gluconacetobacter diazotrophicus]
MADTDALSTGRLLRRPGPPRLSRGFPGVQIDDPRFAEVIGEDAQLLVLHEGASHGEGTVWLPQLGCLLWSDVANRRLLRWREADGEVSVAIDGTRFMNGNALDRDGRVVHCEHGRRAISRSNADATENAAVEVLVSHFEGKRLNSPNDVVVAADGAIWFTDPAFGILVPNQGSLAEQELDHQSVYRFDPGTGVLRRMADFEQPNGLAFSSDGLVLYVSDTSLSLRDIPGEHATGRLHRIERFDVAANGTLSNRAFFCNTDHGVPDGLKVDGRGWVWTTAGDGIHVWAPDGRRLGFIPTPEVAANCCFGGSNGKRLFIAAESYLLAIDLR